MSLLDAIILGAVQGVSEFLPISSDGHLVLAGILLGNPLQGRDALGFDILLHAGSLLALLIGYRAMWKRLIIDLVRREQEAFRVAMLLIIATIPGVIAGLFLEDLIGELRSFTAAGFGFIVTGSVLIIGEQIGKRTGNGTIVRPVHALLIGVAQAVAILPGVSRSGSTVGVGRAFGIERERALDFSFMMAAPIIAGAVCKTLLDAWTGEVAFPGAASSAAGFFSSFAISFMAISFLRLFVRKHSIAVFAWYVIPLGALLLVLARG